MNNAAKRYLETITSLNNIQVPRTDRIVTRLLLLFIVVTLVFLRFTPWIQTAYGTGSVSSLSPQDRIQAISALVEGQIQQWHVKEGDTVKAGDPIVTLIDADQELIARLDAQLNAIEQQQKANLSAIRTTEQDLVRRRELLKEGLVSKRDVEQVQLKLDDLRAKAAKTTADLNKVKVSKARQSIQTKTAPQSGIIVRLLSAGNSTRVKAGDVLASFIPEEVQRSVVLTVNGLDAPLVKEGRKVRLQFDGWPVFQFSGWPSTAIGTFSGEVEFVEPIADEQGRFRVWVKEDAEEHPWPEQKYARLGSRVRGWILLEEVTLGYELWRQLNNFPPVNAEQQK
ncbi:efflux RND transporter periplasmic adaptor subunit [Alteromonas sp. a30]|uniref:efflux RND transporter periplasmic adaptor subunit n=1 Tax=Alteromonas sp. a30 TaxID=2730917 RepID=UPI00227FF950|nr:HlyD family efflux transporter periplasmic adaptor subunit [Alteromonas sp. a30]MCY7294695.1 HlyD family efflux transporter periplasmic adaptor subunit [Alteromonas sp. a30]